MGQMCSTLLELKMSKTKLIKIAAIATLLAVSSQGAFAQQHGHKGAGKPGTGPGMMGRGMMGQGMMHGRMMGRDCPMMGMMMGDSDDTFAKGRIAFLKAELAITDGQKDVFAAYASALKDNLQNMRGMRQSMMGSMSAKTPVERLDAHLAMMEGRVASLSEVKPKLEALYGALSADQKTKANKLLTGMGCMR
jgi:hypothetical protein